MVWQIWRGWVRFGMEDFGTAERVCRGKVWIGLLR